MRAVVSWHNVSTAWACARRQSHRLSRALAGAAWLGLAVGAFVNNVVSWTGLIERMYAAHGGYTPEWPFLPVAHGAVFAAPWFALFMASVLFDSRRRLWPVVLLVAAHFIPFLIVPVLVLLAWDLRRRR